MEERRWIAAGKILLRTVMLVTGLFFLALGIALSTKSGLGVSPISSLPYALSQIFPLSMGVFTTAENLVFLLLQVILLGRNFKPQRLLQLAVVFAFGYFTDFTLRLVAPLTVAAYPARLGLSVLSCAVTGFGIFLEIRARLVVMSNEGALSVISDKTGKEFGTVKIFNDLTIVVLTLIVSLLALRRVVGVREGTLLSAFLVGIFAQFFHRHIRVFDAVLDESRAEMPAPGAAAPLVITFTRQWGTGGHDVAERLARELGLPFYDYGFVTKAAGNLEGANLPRDAGYVTGFLYTMYNQANSFARDQSDEDRLFEAEGREVRKLAREESCVIISRLAPYYLRRHPNVFNIFLSANDEVRLNNLYRPGVDRDRLLELIHREDEMRNEYCLRYAGVPWALARHFQLSLDMSRYSVEETVGLIRSVLAKWER